MYEKLVLFYTNLDGYDIFMPFYYKGNKKLSAKERAEYDFFNIALEVKKEDRVYSFKFQSQEFYISDYFYSGNINDYAGPIFMTLDEYFQKIRLKMSEDDEKMLKREIKIAQLTGNQ